LMIVYRLFWDDFSSWYLEAVKPDYQKPIDSATQNATVAFFDELMKLIHPFMPFITEEIWQLLSERKDDESIMLCKQADGEKVSASKLKSFDLAKQIISSVRTIRKEKNIPMKDGVDLLFTGDTKSVNFDKVISRLARLNEFSYTEAKPEGAMSFIAGTGEFFIPVGDMLDVGAEIVRIKSDLEYQKGFLNSVMKKLGNERFVNNAPGKVVEIERRKLADAELKIEVLEKSLKDLEKK